MEIIIWSVVVGVALSSLFIGMESGTNERKRILKRMRKEVYRNKKWEV